MRSSRISSTATSIRACGLDSPSPRSAERFVLHGRSATLDPRIHAYRRDLADAALADRLFAPHYARAEAMDVTAIGVAVRGAPDATSGAVSELARGEGFAVLDRAGDWAWGYCVHDHYVGYVPAAALGPPAATSHVIDAPAALVFAAADIKSPVIARWPLGVRFTARAEAGEFIGTGEGFVHRRHARAIGAAVADPVAVAESLIGVPYRWGGRGGDGIDCSGLVQRALGLAGIDAPRDSDMQRALGTEIAAEAPLRRGDLVFLAGHVGIMADADMLVHANAHWLRVTAEPLADVAGRAGGGGAIVARRRVR